MTDRELLELAAKAAGIAILKCTCTDPLWPFRHDEKASGKRGHWNPLTDDGDALRLAVKLGFDLRLPSSPNQVFAQVGERGSVPFALERIDGNPFPATRRAIVRAAAEIGRAMP